jgi:hypothetical protein
MRRTSTVKGNIPLVGEVMTTNETPVLKHTEAVGKNSKCVGGKEEVQ